MPNYCAIHESHRASKTLFNIDIPKENEIKKQDALAFKLKEVLEYYLSIYNKSILLY